LSKSIITRNIKNKTSLNTTTTRTTNRIRSNRRAIQAACCLVDGVPVYFRPSGIIAQLSVKCVGNVSNSGAFAFTSSSYLKHVQNAAASGTGIHGLGRKQRGPAVGFDSNSLRIEPTQYTLQTGSRGLNDGHLTSLVVDCRTTGLRGLRLAGARSTAIARKA
jgi:hypothetical protein